MDYSIKPQTIKIDGEQAEVMIKRITRRPGEGKEGMTFFPITFPLLKVVVTAPKMGSEQLEISWSNFYSDSDPVNPGKWFLRLVDQIPKMLYEKDFVSKRVMMHKGRKVEDKLTMAKLYGTTFEPGIGWTYGEDHPMERTVLHESETSSVAGIEAMLEAKFGNELMSEILNLFVTHELFTEFLRPMTPQEAVSFKSRMRMAA